MKITNQSVELLTKITEEDMLKTLELAGRVCYKSEDKITTTSAKKFVQSIMKNNHQSVLEHINLSFRLITDRGASHELVRHRICSLSMESTRYVKYNEVEFIRPIGMDKSELEVWEYYMNYAESNYRAMINFGLTPEQARTVLPHSTKTELIMTANIREWLHIIKLRTSNAAHPQIKHLIGMVAEVLAINYPSIFDNV